MDVKFSQMERLQSEKTFPIPSSDIQRQMELSIYPSLALF